MAKLEVGNCCYIKDDKILYLILEVHKNYVLLKDIKTNKTRLIKKENVLKNYKEKELE